MNQVLEQYLRCFINYYENNWMELLLVSKLVYNNTLQEYIHQILLFANYVYDTRFEHLNLILTSDYVRTCHKTFEDPQRHENKTCKSLRVAKVKCRQISKAKFKVREKFDFCVTI